MILLDNGQVLTFGNYQKGQLGRDAPQDDVGGASALNTREELAIRKLWFAYPDVIPDIGSDRGRHLLYSTEILTKIGLYYIPILSRDLLKVS